MRPSVVSVIGCGPSALRCHAENSPGMRIAVNDAFRTFSTDYAISMDGMFSRHRWRELYEGGRSVFLRRSAWSHALKAGAPPALEWRGRLTVFDCDYETTHFGRRETGAQLNGDHSGYCALNLAYLLRPSVIYLYGYDLNDPTHFFGNYEWHGRGSMTTERKLIKWRKDMREAARQFHEAGISVYNVNPDSAIDAFPHCKPGD